MEEEYVAELFRLQDEMIDKMTLPYTEELWQGHLAGRLQPVIQYIFTRLFDDADETIFDDTDDADLTGNRHISTKFLC